MKIFLLLKSIESSPKEANSEEQTTDVDSLRQIIKLSPSQEDKSSSSDNKLNSENTSSSPINPSADSSDAPSSAKGTLELKREILQRIKDFDFQIKKNHEELEDLNQRLDSVTKDLDDLVGLYEIVSEQMNPFVGLSSVTRRRIEALENYTTEIEEVKQRIAELEAFAERAGAKIKKMQVKPVKKHQGLDINLSDKEMDAIIEGTFDEISVYPEVDNVIDRFIEKLKTGG